MFCTCVCLCVLKSDWVQWQVLSNFCGIGTSHSRLLRRRSLSSRMLQADFVSLNIFFILVGFMLTALGCEKHPSKNYTNNYDIGLCLLAQQCLFDSRRYIYVKSSLLHINHSLNLHIYYYYFCPCGQYGLVTFLMNANGIP